MALPADILADGVQVRHLQFTNSHLQTLKDTSLKSLRPTLESLSIRNGKLAQVGFGLHMHFINRITQQGKRVGGNYCDVARTQHPFVREHQSHHSVQRVPGDLCAHIKSTNIVHRINRNSSSRLPNEKRADCTFAFHHILRRVGLTRHRQRRTNTQSDFRFSGTYGARETRFTPSRPAAMWLAVALSLSFCILHPVGEMTQMGDMGSDIPTSDPTVTINTTRYYVVGTTIYYTFLHTYVPDFLPDVHVDVRALL